MDITIHYLDEAKQLICNNLIVLQETYNFSTES